VKPTTPKDALEMLCAAVEVCAERDDVALEYDDGDTLRFVDSDFVLIARWGRSVITNTLSDEDEDDKALIKRLARALEWSLPLAEEAHEQHYPGETYEKDNYVAHQVQHARNALKDGNTHLDAVEMEQLERLPNSGLY